MSNAGFPSPFYLQSSVPWNTNVSGRTREYTLRKLIIPNGKTKPRLRVIQPSRSPCMEAQSQKASSQMTITRFSVPQAVSDPAAFH